MKRVQFKKEVEVCLVKAFAMFNITHIQPSEVSIHMETKGRVAGWACMARGHYSLKFNAQAIEDHYEEMVNDVIPHEVAHIICFLDPTLGRNHNSGWVRVCKMLGGSGARTHRMDLKPGKRKTEYNYMTDSGTKFTLSPQRHNAVLQGRKFTLRKTGEVVTPQHCVSYTITETTGHSTIIPMRGDGTTSVTVAAPKPKPKPTRITNPTTTKLSKREHVEQIMMDNPTLSRGETISLIIAVVGMTKAGASTYYQNAKKKILN